MFQGVIPMKVMNSIDSEVAKMKTIKITVILVTEGIHWLKQRVTEWTKEIPDESLLQLILSSSSSQEHAGSPSLKS